jgi:hypothetical protein
MSSTLDALRSLATMVAGALPRAGDVAGLGPADEVEAARVLGGIRSSVSDAISLLAADIERRSARELGTAGLAQRNGFTDGARFLQDLTGVRRDEAARLIRVGGLLETAEKALAPADPDGGGAPGVAKPPVRSLDALNEVSGSWDAPLAVALKYGWLSAAHADAVRTGLRDPRSPEHAEAWRRAVLELIAECWSGHWSPEELARAAKRARASLDTLAAAEEAAHRYEQRSLRRLVRSSGMVHYDIELDPESDARFYGPIKRLLSPRFGGPRFTAQPDIDAADELAADPRTNAQLQVDTLIELIDRAVGTDDGELFKTHEPQVTIAVTSAELRKARDGQPGIAWISGRDEPVTAVDALRMICVTGFTPMLFDESGQSVDLGRDQRYFTRTQRRAIAARDGGCLHPGCERPPEDCEHHHINPWAANPAHRRSEVRDGVLLCRRHHKMVHDHGARITRDGADYRLHWPGRPPARLHPAAGIRTQLHLAACESDEQIDVTPDGCRSPGLA